MDSSLFGLVELVLVFGIVLGLAVWELRSLRKSQARDREAERKEAAQAEGRGESD
ncbi:MAG: hypothetical protein AB7P37_01550 [Ramlibacter sp.]